MINELSNESRQSINGSIIIWFSMLIAQFIYLFVCFYILDEGLYKAIFDQKILTNTLFMNIDIHNAIYLVSIIILITGYLYFKKAYSHLISETKKQNFKDIEEEFKYFKEKYLSIMFISLAIFEIIVILGIVVFFTTLNFIIITNLVIIAVLGFLLVIPSKGKFDY